MVVEINLPQELQDEFVGVSHGDLERVKTLLALHPELVHSAARWGETPIQAAAQLAHVPLMRLLLDAGAPLDICTAAALGDHSQVTAMLAVDPSSALARGAHGIPLLYFAAIRGDLPLAETLLAAGALLNDDNEVASPLHGAVMFRQFEMARWLLDHGAHNNTKDFNGKTPLEAASESGQLQMVDLIHSYLGQ